ncbi:hypothetical protein [Sphingopyxis sp. 22461]|uniref:hypothetical protein n=1 Tax=Sphingopyxis sp. 22461 TaxID=3453923 RepID=UPI003F84AE04
MARAIIEAQGYSPSENELARARDEVPGILAALTEAGYAIVPIEPTEEMLTAGNSVEMTNVPDCDPPVELPDSWGIYRAMLRTAAPIDTKEGE